VQGRHRLPRPECGPGGSGLGQPFCVQNHRIPCADAALLRGRPSHTPFRWSRCPTPPRSPGIPGGFARPFARQQGACLLLVRNCFAAGSGGSRKGSGSGAPAASGRKRAAPGAAAGGGGGGRLGVLGCHEVMEGGDGGGMGSPGGGYGPFGSPPGAGFSMPSYGLGSPAYSHPPPFGPGSECHVGLAPWARSRQQCMAMFLYRRQAVALQGISHC
jgi:hypothetical protein